MQLEGLRPSKVKPSRYLQAITSCFSTHYQSKKPPHTPIDIMKGRTLQERWKAFSNHPVNMLLEDFWFWHLLPFLDSEIVTRKLDRERGKICRKGLGWT